MTSNRQLFGEMVWNSLEKEHIPKVARRMVIRQDNSIEVSLSRTTKRVTQSLSDSPYHMNSVAESHNKALNATLNIPQPQNSERRKTIETCENIFQQSEENIKLNVRTPPSNPHRILLYRDKTDKSIRSLCLRICSLKLVILNELQKVKFIQKKYFF